MVSKRSREAVRQLARNTHPPHRLLSTRSWREILRRLVSPPVAPPTTGWHDLPSWERPGWRERRAVLDDDVVFAIDYIICLQCQRGWVEQPYTDPDYQGCGLARAALAQLRTEHPDLSWHTLGNHSSAPEFWNAVAAGTPGGYEQRPQCNHQ
jgi:hypothetical protein